MVNRTIATTASAILIAATVVPLGGTSFARDTKRPKIVSAAMVDTNKNDRADQIVLKYSEKVRHRADKDGDYPFTVAGYKVKKVGAAKGSRTLKLSLKERRRRDIAAAPSVGYEMTSSKPVKDLSQNEAKGQTFERTKPLDRDLDGFTKVGGDCKVKNPDFAPDSVDEPELHFKDLNCDGVDGDAASSIFVSPAGIESNAGTREAPLLDINAAITMAAEAEPAKDVLVAVGDYEGALQLASGVSIFGGYDPTDWSRSDAELKTNILGKPEGALADGDVDVLLQLLTITGEPSAAAGDSAYGLRAINGSDVTIHATEVIGAAALNGQWGDTPGTIPPNGAGFNGGNGGPGGYGSSGGAPGLSGAGPVGGSGGPGGAYNLTGGAGLTGGPGTPGASGSGGQFVIDPADTTWNTARGKGGTGGTGGPGSGGGGGGGGGGYTYSYPYDCNCDTWGGCDTCWSTTYYSGGRGGNGGNGGGGSTGGSGGYGGGGSFGVFLHDSTLTAIACVISSGEGGDGGLGLSGPSGGQPGFAGAGSSATGGWGGWGGAGGRGGHGGGGGGGAGGPSIAVLKNGTTSVVDLDAATTLTAGDGGPGAPGGNSAGNSGVEGEDGLSALIYPPPAET